MIGFWKFVTDFGDTAVTVPLAALMALFLVAMRQFRQAIDWCAAIVGCAAAISALKLAFAVCGDPLVGPVLRSPSGHTAMSIAVYGGFAAVMGARLSRPARIALTGGAGLLAVAIAVSRGILHYHSWIEVGAGFAVGSAALAAIAWMAARRPTARLPIPLMAAAAVAVGLAFHGERWPAEQALHRIAGLFLELRRWCT